MHESGTPILSGTATRLMHESGTPILSGTATSHYDMRNRYTEMLGDCHRMSRYVMPKVAKTEEIDNAGIMKADDERSR